MRHTLHVLLRLVPLLLCPWCAEPGLVPSSFVHEELIDGSLNCSSCHATTVIVDGIWRAMGASKIPKTLSQLTNVMRPTAELYERLWRHRSLGLLSKGTTSTDSELDELRSVFVNVSGQRQIIVDVGCSEGLYARTLAVSNSATVIAVDHSLAFLRRVRKCCAELPVIAVQASAQCLPLAHGSVDGVVMGGSLNEIGDEVAAVAETARVAKSGALMFSMSLLESRHLGGRLAQRAARLGAIDFFDEEETVNLFRPFFDLRPPTVNGVVIRMSGVRRS
jgi:precorrin-6B methylase 2/uncharacterized protein YbaR (Trm112 family)